jgi:hypothetical protein
MGSTAPPRLTAQFQNARYVITNRVVNNLPVWAAENGNTVIYRGDGHWWISENEDCVAGVPRGWMWNTLAFAENITTPTQLGSRSWAGLSDATLGRPQFRDAM